MVHARSNFIQPLIGGEAIRLRPHTVLRAPADLVTSRVTYHAIADAAWL
jgi:hypothetical protein